MHKTSVSKDRYFIKSMKEVPGDVLHTPTALVYMYICNYGNDSVSWTVNVATRLTSSSHNLVSKAF